MSKTGSVRKQRTLKPSGGTAAADETAGVARAVAALLKEPLELPLLASLGVSTEALEALFDGGYLVPVSAATARLGDSVDRESEAGRLAWSERRRLHERVATLLAAKADRCVEAAEHYLAACRYAEARRLLLREAEAACGAKRYEEALHLVDRCLAVWPADEDAEARLKVLGEMVRCARNCGRHDAARRALRETLEMVTAAEQHGPAMETHQQFADLCLLEEDFAGARRHLEAAAGLAEKAGPSTEAARSWLALASFLANQTRPGEAHAALRRARELAGDPADAALDSELLGYEGLLHAMQGNTATAKTLGERSLAIAVEHQLNREAALAYRRLANIREYSSHYTAERDAHLQAIALCRQQNDAGFEVSCMVCLSYVFFRTGEWKRAQETIKDITRRPDSHPGCRAGATGVQAMIAAFRGEQRQTLALLQEAGAGLRRYGVLLLEFHLLWAQAYMMEAAGDRHGAGAAYSRLLDHWDRTEDRHDVLPGAVSAAAFFGDEGEWRQVARIRDIMHTVVNANDNEESRASRLAVLGESAAEKRDWSLASTHLAAALEGYDKLGVPVERVLMRGRLARMLAAAGREREAAEVREAGAAIARPLGMRGALGSLDAPEAGGSGPRRNEVLTARQHDVLRLLAAGLTNKEAADRLSLSPRTVEMHVAALLDRLNCRTRTEAMHRAGELGLLD